jgi:hypothetical protein
MAQRLTTFDYLFEHLKNARLYDDSLKQQLQGGEPMHIQLAGKTIVNAYEQLRNATEYDGSIALQHAIKRFFKRALFITHHKPEQLGHELITELILSGYLKDDSLGGNAAQMVTNLAMEHLALYKRLRSSKSRNTQRNAVEWTLSVLSVRTQSLLLPHTHDLVIASYACQYFLDTLQPDDFAQSKKEAGLYNDALYVAVHQALLQSDLDTVRADLLRAHGLDGTDLQEYIHWCNYAYELYTSSLTLRLKRVVSRNGAPFRILLSLADSITLDEVIAHRDQFLRAYHHQINSEYRRINTRLNSGVVKSVVFLFLTKVAIGLAVEVPFDRYMYGHVIALPLTINLLFPPLYMTSIRLGLSVPSASNAQATVNFMDQLLYSDPAPTAMLPKSPSKRAGARLGYGIFFLIPFGVTYLILHALGFSVLQMAIFLVFFSTASFLGFRLSLMVRELRMTRRTTGVLAMLRDLFYLPFILVGQWLASKYAKVNVIGEILDLIIELPLKTVLSLVRQWIRFLSETHEELY